MDASLDAILEALAAQHEELTGLLSDLDDVDWRRPSPCEGWDVADVVLHLTQTDQMAIASLADRFHEALAAMTAGLGPTADVDEGAAAMVARERDRPPSEIHAAWRSTAADLRRAFTECDPSIRVTWVAGELAPRTLATTRLAEGWIHSGDVAAALGVDLAPTDGLAYIARLAWRTLPYAFARDGRELTGPVAFDLMGPGGDEWSFHHEGEAATTIRGPALDLCLLAGRRVLPDETALEAVGPDADAVLELVRTYA